MSTGFKAHAAQNQIGNIFSNGFSSFVPSGFSVGLSQIYELWKKEPKLKSRVPVQVFRFGENTTIQIYKSG